MAEENTGAADTEPQVQPPKTSAIRDYMSAKFPDKQYPDDHAFDTALLDHLSAADAKIAGNEQANQAIMEVISANPEFAEIIEDVASGVPVQVAIARQFSPEDLSVEQGEPDYEAYKKAAAERTKRLTTMKEQIDSREKNIARSKTDVDAFFADKGMDEKECTDFIEWVDNEILANLIDGKIDKGILTKLYQGWVFDEAVADARNAGEVEGRNQQIEKKRARASVTDGLASEGGGVATDEQPKPTPDIIDDVLARKATRKF